MKKTNLNTKRTKFIKRLLLFSAVQVLIIAVAVISFNTVDIDSDELNTATVVVDEIVYEYEFISGRVFAFYSKGEKYCFPKYPVYNTNEYSMNQLYETITVGDELVVEYMDETDRKLIFSAKKEGNILRSLDGYFDFAKNQRTAGIIGCTIIELVYLAILILFILYHYKELKFFSTGKRKNSQ